MWALTSSSLPSFPLVTRSIPLVSASLFGTVGAFQVLQSSSSSFLLLLLLAAVGQKLEFDRSAGQRVRWDICIDFPSFRRLEPSATRLKSFYPPKILFRFLFTPVSTSAHTETHTERATQERNKSGRVEEKEKQSWQTFVCYVSFYRTSGDVRHATKLSTILQSTESRRRRRSPVLRPSRRFDKGQH